MKASLALLSLLFVLGCEKENTTKPDKNSNQSTAKQSTSHSAVESPPRKGPTNIAYDKGPIPSLDTVIASAEDQKVTIKDFEFASKLAIIVVNDGKTDLPPERMALAHVHFTMSQSLLSRKMAGKRAKERGFTVTNEEKIAWIKGQKGLARLVEEGVDSAALLKPYGVKFEELLNFAESEVFVKKFVESELEKVTRKEIWEAYSKEKNVIKAVVASVNNVPNGHEIDAFLERRPDEIKAYFSKHKKEFRIPKRVRVDRLSVKKEQKEKAESLLKDAAEGLRKGDRIEDIAKELNLEMGLDEKLIFQENKRAFTSKPGTSGYDLKGPRGANAWIVRGFIPSREGDLSSSTQREIAAKILRDKEISPALYKRLILAKDKILKKITEKNAKKKGEKFSNYGLRWRVTEFTNNGFVKEFGLVEELTKEAFEHKKGFIGGPIKSREYVYLYKILNREHASKKTFDKKYKLFRSSYIKAKRPVVMPQFMSSIPDTNINPNPLRIKWGVLKKS